MNATADFVIVGGGVHGASLAFHLASTGAGSVILLEQHTLASGPTGRSGAMIRPLFTERAYIELVTAATVMFEEWDVIVGGDAGYRQPGFVRIVSEWTDDQLGADLKLFEKLGVRHDRISQSDLSQYVPLGTFHDGELGLFLPDGGFADPVWTTRTLARAAEQAGATIMEGVAVTGVSVTNGRIQAVETSAGRIASPVVVNCAGAWSRDLARMVGVELPIEDHRTPTAILYAPEGYPDGAPIQSDVRNKVYMRSMGANLLRVAHFGWHPDLANPDDFDETVSQEQLRTLRGASHQRAPSMRFTPVFGGFSAIYDMTPDGHPIVGLVDGPDGFWCNCGWSGNGFASAPAVGRSLAQLITQQPPDIDLSFFAWPRRDDITVRPDIQHVHQ